MLVEKLLVQDNAFRQIGNQASNPVSRETWFQNKYTPLQNIYIIFFKKNLHIVCIAVIDFLNFNKRSMNGEALANATNKNEEVRNAALTNVMIAKEGITKLRGLYETAQKELNKHMGK